MQLLRRKPILLPLCLLLAVAQVYAAGGSISVTSSPTGADVYLDGELKGTAPVFISNVNPGSRVVACRKSGYEDFQQTVAVVADRAYAVTCTLTPVSVVEPTVPETPPPATGSIRITTNNPEASFTILGPDAFVGSGSTWTKENVPVGEYTVTFNQVSGYKTPATQTVTVEAGRRAMVSVTYEKERSLLPIAGAVLILIALGAGGFYAVKRKGIALPKGAPKGVKAAPGSLAVDGVIITPEVKYSGASVLYEVQIENRSSQPIGEVLVSVHAPSSLISLENEKAVQAVEPGGKQGFSFEMRPTGAFGTETIVGRVSFYDYQKDKRQDASLDAVKVSVDVPSLKAGEIDEMRFKKFISSALFSIDEGTQKNLPLEAPALFNLAASVLESTGLYALRPSVSETSELFRGVARFYGEDIRGLKYAAEIEVIGDAEGTQMLLKAWGMRDDVVCGFYHKILDQLEGRTRVKKFIEDKIVQDFYWRQDKEETEFLKSLEEAKVSAEKEYQEWMEKSGG